MQLFDIGQMPTAIDITLYRYNYIDNKLWTQIHNDVEYIEYDKDSIMISKNQLEHIIEKYYASSLNKIKTLGSEVIYKEINSIYFLYKMCSEMINVKYIKINLNMDKSYDRTIDSYGDKVLQFGFKVLTATLRLTDLYDTDELPIVNQYLEEMGILTDNSPFVRIKAMDLVEILEQSIIIIEERGDTEKDTNVLIDIIELLQPKLQPENTLILIITDY